MNKRLNILVVEDSSKHQEAARVQLASHNVTIVGTYDKGQELLTPKIDYKKEEVILKGKFGDFNPYRSDDEGRKREYFAAQKMANEQATTYPDFDVVLLDLMLPASMCGVNGPGRSLEGQEMPLGTILAFLALKNRCKNVAIVTDTNHHKHPASAALDAFKRTRFHVGDVNLYLADNLGKEVKDWAYALKAVTGTLG